MKKYILGAVIGDIVGSIYEFNNHKTKDFSLFQETCSFTDDTVLTVASAESILNNTDYAETYIKYGKNYPHRGYGGKFSVWLKSDNALPYNSFGNGSAMRVSPVGWAYDSLEEVLENAAKSASVTHNHPEGIKGAQATASAIFLARTGASKREIKDYIQSYFKYDLDRTCDEIRPYYEFNETCQETVPEAVIAFLESTDFEDSIRTAISLGGDSDTLAAITCSISQAYYKEIPKQIIDSAIDFLPIEIQNILNEFGNKYMYEL